MINDTTGKETTFDKRGKYDLQEIDDTHRVTVPNGDCIDGVTNTSNSSGGRITSIQFHFRDGGSSTLIGQTKSSQQQYSFTRRT